MKTNQVHACASVPIAPSRRWSSKVAAAEGPRRPSLVSSRSSPISDRLSFIEAFGVLGLLLLIVALVCIAWTSWLILLTHSPTWTANYLMNTETFDEGNFWLIVDTEPWMIALSLSGLILVELGYIYVLLKMVIWRNNVPSLAESFSTHVMAWKLSGLKERASRLPNKWRPRAIGIIWRDLTGFYGPKRKFWNLWLKTVDLTLQTIALAQMLESGFPKILNYSYAAMVAINALSCVVMITYGSKHSAFTEVLIDTVFDMAFAVVSPIAVLAYCYSNFDFDREVLAINKFILPGGGFETQARLLADPSEIFLFRTSFDSLRILSVTDFLLRIGMNLSFVNRFKRVVEVLVARRRRMIMHQRQRSSSQTVIRQQQLPRVAALPYVLFGILVIVATHKSIETSDAACQAYPQCVVFAQRWNSGGVCPCLILIDTEKAPKTWEEWVSPIDETETVRQLAKSGDLRALQLINRRLGALPEELSYCRNMRHISLIYTELESLPTWAKQFAKLEYLCGAVCSILSRDPEFVNLDFRYSLCVQCIHARHIEGKLNFNTLLSLPDDLFIEMHHLAFLHLGVHIHLAKLPTFEGLSSLKHMILALLASITEIPSFGPLKKLERLDFAYLPALRTLSDMSPLSKFQTLTTVFPMQFCCDGFLGTCDLTHPYCVANPAANISQVECIRNESEQATPATKRVFVKNAATACQLMSAVAPDPIRKASVGICGGELFRQCEVPTLQENGSTTLRIGMCVNPRMQVLTCSSDPMYVQVRKEQILRGVGPTCDPAVEGWLGCSGMK